MWGFWRWCWDMLLDGRSSQVRMQRNFGVHFSNNSSRRKRTGQSWGFPFIFLIIKVLTVPNSTFLKLYQPGYDAYFLYPSGKYLGIVLNVSITTGVYFTRTFHSFCNSMSRFCYLAIFLHFLLIFLIICNCKVDYLWNWSTCQLSFLLLHPMMFCHHLQI